MIARLVTALRWTVLVTATSAACAVVLAGLFGVLP